VWVVNAGEQPKNSVNDFVNDFVNNLRAIHGAFASPVVWVYAAEQNLDDQGF
jgi:hypothetical protein